MKTAYSYIRFSTLDQKKGASTARQTEAAKQWCQQNGFTLSDERFFDPGKSGFKGEHLKADGELKRFFSLVESGRIKPGSVLIVESFDRLSRLEPIDAMGLFTDIIRAGIGLVFTMTFDKKLITKQTLAKEQHLFYAILGEAQRAHSESKHKSERVKDAYDRRKLKAKESGHKTAAWCPPWCDFIPNGAQSEDSRMRAGGEYVPNKEGVAIVKRIYAEYLKGNGPFRICNMFNREKVPTLGHRAHRKYVNTTQEWYKKTVRDLLKDKRVYGFAEFLDKENYYPAVISLEEFKRVQARFVQRGEAAPTGGPKENNGNLFTGICRCAHCGSVMAKTTTNKTYKHKTTHYEYLVCDGARSGMGCSYKSMPYDLMERVFNMAITRSASAILTGKTNDKEANERLAELQGEFAMNDEKIQRLVDKITNDDNAPKSLVAMLKNIEGEQTRLTKAIAVAEAQADSAKFLPANMKEMVAMWNEYLHLTKTQDGRLKMREYIHATISKIVLDPKGEQDGDGNTINFQIHFKTGKVLSVLIYSERPENQITLTVWQPAEGEVKKFDWNSGAAHMKGIRDFATKEEDEAYTKKIMKMLSRKVGEQFAKL